MSDSLPRTPTTTIGRIAALVVATAVVSTAGALLAGTPASAATAHPLSQTYSTAGSGEWSVPAGVYRVSIGATGGGGGDGAVNGFCSYGFGGAAGQVTGYLDVHPGDRIAFAVGGGGHLSGAGGYGGVFGGGDGGANDGGLISGNGGGGGGATTVTYGNTRVAVAGGGGGGGGRGISAVVCGGDGGAGGNPAQNGFNGTAATANGGYGPAGRTGGQQGERNGLAPLGAGSGGGGGGGGDGVSPGQGGGADNISALSGGGGGGGAGGLSVADALLKDAAFDTSGGSGSAGSVTFIWGSVTTTSVPPVVTQGGTVTLHAVVSDTDGGGTVAFSYSDGSTQQTIQGCGAVPLVFELDSTYLASCTVAAQLVPADTVTATYSGDYAYGLSIGSGPVTVNQLTSTTALTASPTAVPQYDMTQLTATVAADGYGTVAFAEDGDVLGGCRQKPLTPAGSSTATATCGVQIVSGTHVYTATYSGDRAYRSSASGPVTVAVQGEPSITGTPPAGTVGQDYGFSYTLTGDPTPTTSVTGTLPGGLTLSAAGRLSGTPSTAGTYTFTVAAANGVDTVTTESTIVVAPADGTPSISGAPGAGAVGVGYSFDYVVDGDPSPTAAVTSGELPPGLSLSPSGHLAGTPTAAGTSTFTVTVTNTVGTDSTESTVAVAAGVPGAPRIGTAIPHDGAATIAFTPPSSDGGSPITGYVATATPVSGSFGLASVASTPPVRTSSGTTSPITIPGLTNGVSYTVTVAALNGVGTGPASTPSNGITPSAPLRVTTATLPGGTASRTYTTTLAATGGSAPYAWSLGRGSHLPSGLTLRSDGTLSGTPKTAGTTTFAVVVTDSSRARQTVTQRLSLTVAAAPRPDLAVTLAPTTGFVHGRTAEYRVTVTNTGNAPTTTPTVVTLALGRGLTAQGAIAPGWSCTQQGLRCTTATSIAPGQHVTYVVRVAVPAAVGARVTGTVYVSPNDATPANNHATETETVKRG